MSPFREPGTCTVLSDEAAYELGPVLYDVAAPRDQLLHSLTLLRCVGHTAMIVNFGSYSVVLVQIGALGAWHEVE